MGLTRDERSDAAREVRRPCRSFQLLPLLPCLYTNRKNRIQSIPCHMKIYTAYIIIIIIPIRDFLTHTITSTTITTSKTEFYFM